MQWMDEGLKWMAIHPLRMDGIVLALVAGTIVYILKYARKHRRIAHRRMWAMVLKRKDLERLHLMRFEDAITDAAFEMVARGEMTEAQEKEWYDFFANQYGMKGLRPPPRTKESVKKSLKTRHWMRELLKMKGKWFPAIPEPPSVVVDKSYDPTPFKLKSKYVKE